MELRASSFMIRDFQPEDAASLAENANDRGVWIQLRDRFPHPYTVELARGYIGFVNGNAHARSWAIDVGGRAIGGIALHAREDIERIGNELGYWLGRTHWGHGIATEAIRLLTRHAFEHFGLARVFAIPFADNLGSCRALEKAGFEREATMRKSAIKDGVIRDQALYARVI